MYEVLLLIIKIIFCRLLLLIIPAPIMLFTIAWLILCISVYHIKLTLGRYGFLLESYDLISKSLIILTIWVIVLIVVAQSKVEYKKALMINISILLIRLIITFSTVRIVIFYFFFWMVVNSYFFYYYRVRISARTTESQASFIFLYSFRFLTFTYFNLIKC